MIRHLSRFDDTIGVALDFSVVLDETDIFEEGVGGGVESFVEVHVHRIEIDVVVGIISSETNDRFRICFLTLSSFEIVNPPIIL